MSVYIPSFRSKDPNDVEPKNFDAAGKLARLGNPTVLSVAVVVDPLRGCADGALIITEAVFDPTTKRVSFLWSGGTLGQTYCVTCRLSISPTWSVEQSAFVTIALH